MADSTMYKIIIDNQITYISYENICIIKRMIKCFVDAKCPLAKKLYLDEIMQFRMRHKIHSTFINYIINKAYN